MSYCRWSSDDYQSDVYVYESAQGWETCVAARRYVFAEPLPAAVPFPVGPGTDEQWAAWLVRGRVVDEILSRSELVPIGLPHDGETYLDASPGECADRLEALRGAGYHVPQYAIDALRDEANPPSEEA